MATRARNNRNQIPGYDELRPSRDERQRERRRVRHATRQALNTVSAEDPEDLEPLPEVRRSATSDTHAEEDTEPTRNRFKVWKTKFWKRRNSYRDMKAEMDADWPVITEEQL
ncbi:MAG: hypothetical protein GEU79_04565 [Acidimicrobiia bacterium]|nr:hypothetical protein [Acidimicrobiia bacterium]